MEIIVRLETTMQKIQLYQDIIWIFFMLGILLFLISELSSTVRRLHDLNKSGLNYFFFFIPFYNIYLWLALYLKKGTTGNNSFGRDPIK